MADVTAEQAETCRAFTMKPAGYGAVGIALPWTKEECARPIKRASDGPCKYLYPGLSFCDWPPDSQRHIEGYEAYHPYIGRWVHTEEGIEHEAVGP